LAGLSILRRLQAAFLRWAITHLGTREKERIDENVSVVFNTKGVKSHVS